MSFWSEQLTPRLIDKMNNEETRKRREEACAGLTGHVLEIGFGSGLNLPYYPATVTRVTAIEPSQVARRLAGPRVAASTVPVTFEGEDAADLPFPDHSFDAAISTLTLCTVSEAQRAVDEVFRVLKPGSDLHLVEHGSSPEPAVARWQHRLEPLQKKLFAGCHLTREVPSLLEGAGFDLAGLHTGYLPGPAVARPWGYVFQGRAHKPA